MKMNDKRAPRTRNILEVDVVAKAEDNTKLTAMVRLASSSGVCVVGMYETVQPRNLGDPSLSKRNIGRQERNGKQVPVQVKMEVGLSHSIEEVR